MVQSWQKIYVGQLRRPLEFEDGDHVYLRVTPKLGFQGLFKIKKLKPWYIGPFQIISRVREVA